MSNFLRVQKVLRDQRSAKRNSVARRGFQIPERRLEEVRVPTAAHAALDPDGLEEHLRRSARRWRSRISSPEHRTPGPSINSTNV